MRKSDTNQIAVIGYSGHSYVICDALSLLKKDIVGYCEKTEKTLNPYNLKYLGSERDEHAEVSLEQCDYFIAIGDNRLRRNIYDFLYTKFKKESISILHPNSFISNHVEIDTGVYIGNGCIVNPMSKIGMGSICNSQSVIEHECEIGAFSHIAPCAVLCGNVFVGENTFVGARSVIKEGIKIGNNVLIGAGTVVIKDIPDNSIVVGNPQKHIK